MLEKEAALRYEADILQALKAVEKGHIPCRPGGDKNHAYWLYPEKLGFRQVSYYIRSRVISKS